MSAGRGKITLKELVLFAFMGVFCFLGKLLMAGIPNVEPVSLFVMLFAVTFGWKALLPVYTYVCLELVVYPIQLWSINYLYIWLILAVASIFLRKCRNTMVWALLSAAFGIFFGLLCAPVYAVTGGWAFAVSWWISGIPFDLIHGAGNFVMALALFRPLRDLMERLYARLTAS